jgi:short subunit dehydrogenase-like uncharacterized protein
LSDHLLDVGWVHGTERHVGESGETRESGRWEMILIGKMDDGMTVRTRVRGEGDPATDSTSRMPIESAPCLAEDAEKMPVGGGLWTLAAAMGHWTLGRLTSCAGMSFEFEPGVDGCEGLVTSASP